MRIWLGTRSGGRIVDPEQARIDVRDHGFTVADGVFETLKVTAAGPFALTRHVRRLTHSADALGLALPDDTVVRRAVAEVCEGSDLGESGIARLRVTYTAGAGPLGSDRGDAEPTLVVALSPTPAWPDVTTLATVPWTRNERSPLTGVKSTSYAENVIALKYAHDRGASEAVLGNTRGELSEGTGSNVFVVVDGRVLTPPLSSGCLAGITRELVLEWFGAEEQTLALDALLTADEVFITSSTRDVHPVVQVDARQWPGAGPVSTHLRAAFAARAADDLDP